MGAPAKPVNYTTTICRTGIVPDSLGKDDHVYCFHTLVKASEFAAKHGAVGTPMVAKEPTAETKILKMTKLGRMHVACHIASTAPTIWVCHEPEDAHIYEATPANGEPFNIACHHYVGWYE